MSSRWARAPGAPTISEAVPVNICLDWRTGDWDAADAAFAAAAAECAAIEPEDLFLGFGFLAGGEVIGPADAEDVEEGDHGEVAPERTACVEGVGVGADGSRHGVTPGNG